MIGDAQTSNHTGKVRRVVPILLNKEDFNTLVQRQLATDLDHNCNELKKQGFRGRCSNYFGFARLYLCWYINTGGLRVQFTARGTYVRPHDKYIRQDGTRVSWKH